MASATRAWPAASPQGRALRMRELREWHKISREAFVLYGIPTTTMQNWENWETVRHVGLTAKGAKRLVEAYTAMGVQVTQEWLLYGTGPSPIPLREAPEALDTSLSEEAKITQELRLFHQLHKDGVDLIMPDDTMAPLFLPGDCLAGVRYFDTHMEKAIGKPCIIHTQKGQVLARVLEPGAKEGLYTLVANNPQTPPQADIVLFSVAPVLWMRRKSQ